MKDKKIIIIGAGPTGLGAAHRLQELKYPYWHLYERESYAGGLAASFKDELGFTWDIGGHVQFSHYEYFDRLMKKLLKDQWWSHNRESWVWIENRFVPYPFQYNIRYLSKEKIAQSLKGLIYNVQNPPKLKPKNFEEWLLQSFGEGIANIFMLPYNFKVWAIPPRLMQFNWIGERVAIVDLVRTINNILFEKDDIVWGPNNTFQFPKYGGTGQIWRELARRLPQNHLSFQHTVQCIDTKTKTILFTNGARVSYDVLISTIPLNILIQKSNINFLKKYQNQFRFSSVHIIGVGLKGRKPIHLRTKCWMYFPEKNCPYYRATVFSNYSKFNVPDEKKFWSLMLEVSESRYKIVNQNQLLPDVIQGMVNTKLILSKKDIVDIWYREEPYGYPTPFLNRDQILNRVLPAFQKFDIYTRGRFGAWKYEVGNQDHSLMQGVEAVNHILRREKEITVWNPPKANNLKSKT